MTYYEIEFEGNIIIVQNPLNEPINILYNRWYFIMRYLKMFPDTDNTILYNLSHIYINYKYYHCKYPIFLFQKIEKFI